MKYSVCGTVSHAQMLDRDARDFQMNGDNEVSIAMLRRPTRHKSLFRTKGITWVFLLKL